MSSVRCAVGNHPIGTTTRRVRREGPRADSASILVPRPLVRQVGRQVQTFLIGDGWMRVADGDDSCREIFDRHYSRRFYADGRKPKLFVGPGQKLVLFRADGSALFCWRKFKHDYGQNGVNCAVFRNEGSELASTLILEAEAVAREDTGGRWQSERFYTYVDPREVQPTMVRGMAVWGYCFYKAGWSFDCVGKGGKIVLDKEAA